MKIRLIISLISSMLMFGCSTKNTNQKSPQTLLQILESEYGLTLGDVDKTILVAKVDDGYSAKIIPQRPVANTSEHEKKLYTDWHDFVRGKCIGSYSGDPKLNTIMKTKKNSQGEGATLVLIASVSGVAICDDEIYNKGIGMLNKNEHEKAAVELTKCAKNGHGGCAEILGWFYYDGAGVKKNLNKAAYWEIVAWKTGVNFGYAGVSGALTTAYLYCEEHFFNKSYSDIKDWLNNAEVTLTELDRHSPSSNELEFKELREEIKGRIDEIRERVINKKCNI